MQTGSLASKNFGFNGTIWEPISSVNNQLATTSYHADGTEGNLISGTSYVSGKSGIDGSTEALEVIDYAHHEVHSGNHYFVKTYLEDTGSAGNITEFMFITPDTTIRVHARALIAPDIDFTVEIFEGITTSADGTPIARINNDRDSLNTSELIPYAAPTVTDDGTLIWAARNGGGRNAVGVAPGFNYEIKAARDTKYLFRLTKNVANDGIVDIDFFWYEHVDKN